jgi:hypothetical protein
MTPRGKLKDLWHLGTAQRFKENSTNSKIWGNLETSQDLWHLETKLEDDETDKLEGYDNSETVFPCIYDNLETSRCDLWQLETSLVFNDNPRQARVFMTPRDKLIELHTRGTLEDLWQLWDKLAYLWQHQDKLEVLWQPQDKARRFGTPRDKRLWQLETSSRIYDTETSSHLWHLGYSETSSRIYDTSRQARVLRHRDKLGIYDTSRQARRFMTPVDKLAYSWQLKTSHVFMATWRQACVFMTTRGSSVMTTQTRSQSFMTNLETSSQRWVTPRDKLPKIY